VSLKNELNADEDTEVNTDLSCILLVYYIL